MRNLASFLASLGLISALLTISLTHLGFPPVEFEWMVVLSAVTIFMALACTGLALLLVSILMLRKTGPLPVTTSIVTMVTLILSGTWILFGQ